MYQLTEPHVKVHCLYGNNKKTELSYYYLTDDYNQMPQITYTDKGIIFFIYFYFIYCSFYFFIFLLFLFYYYFLFLFYF